MVPDLNEDIKILQKIDPLKIAGEMTGEDYRAHHETSMLGFAIQMEKSIKMSMLMDETNDVKFGEKLKDYIIKITSFGFEKVLQIPFIGKAIGQNDTDKDEFLYVFFEPTKGILLVFDTYNGSSVNSGNMYYNWATDGSKSRGGATATGGYMHHEYNNGLKRLACFDENFDQIFPELPQQIYDYVRENEAYNEVEQRIDDIIYDKKNLHLWVGSHDCREAVIHNISQLENYGQFVPHWKEMGYISLTNYSDWKDDSKTFEEKCKYSDFLLNERLSMLPEWVQIQIGFKK